MTTISPNANSQDLALSSSSPFISRIQTALLSTIVAFLVVVAGCDDADTPYQLLLLTPSDRQDTSSAGANLTPTSAPQSDSQKHPGPAKVTSTGPAVVAVTPSVAESLPTDVNPHYSFAGVMIAGAGVGQADVGMPVAIDEIASSGSPTVTATPVMPADLSELKDVLGSATTSYAGSVPPRAHNVRLGTSRLNGALVAPGEIFSFNEFVGPTTLNAGFQKGFGIILSGGQAETVESVAGGICQVATTLFQAVYWSGLEVVERWYHYYWIQRYGQSPSGFTGLDATVDDPWVDFKFRNTTGNWIWIESKYDDDTITFTIHGIDPGWNVVSSEPEITEVIKASHEEVIREDPEMPAGKTLLIEHAEDGFEMTATRQVIDKHGNVLATYKFVNRYLPSRNVWLVGTKGATPTATPTPLLPTATPTPLPPTATPSPRPDDYRQPDGRIRIPNLVGLPEDNAQRLITEVGLMTTYVNYQGPGDIPDSVLKSVPVGHVLSQMPAGDTAVSPGTTVYVAVRRDQTAFQDASP